MVSAINLRQSGLRGTSQWIVVSLQEDKNNLVISNIDKNKIS
jgi:hypothetical protein